MGDEATEADETVPTGGGGSSIGSMILPAILAGIAAFGGGLVGTMLSSGDEEAATELEEPGPSVNLGPFVLTVPDKKGKPHALKIKLAVELEPEAVTSQFEKYTPRINNMMLSYLRKYTYEQASDTKTHDRICRDLLEQIHELGATTAKAVLIQEFVTQ
jgi:flagellar basal body-associated protein FliL